MASFMDYYEDELKKRQTSKAPSSGVPLSSLKGSSENEGLLSTSNPIGWTLDMISRPFYGVSNVVDKSLDSVAKQDELYDKGDVGGGLAEALGNIAATPGRFLEGLFSNDRSAKNSTSELIEKGTDTFGKAHNPDYVDVQDNVNPVVKGVLGFAGDVAGDPLTWIPGGVLLSGAKAAGKGLKAGATAAKDGALAAKDSIQAAKAVKGAEAVEELAQEAPKAAKVKPLAEPDESVDLAESFLDAPTTPAVKVTDKVAPEPAAPTTFVDTLQLDTPVPKTVTPEAVETALEVITRGQKLSEAVKTPRGVAAGKEVQDLIKTLSKSDEPTVAAIEAKPFDEIKWAKTSPEQIYYTDKGLAKNRSVNEIRTIYLTELAAANGGNLPISPIFRKVAEQALSPRGKQARETYRELLTKAKAAHETTATQAVLSGVEAFQRRIQQGGNALRGILGEDVVDLLASKTSTASATDALSKLESVFGGKLADMDAFLAREPRIDAALGTAFKAEMDAVKTMPNSPEAVAGIEESVKALDPTTDALAAVLREQNLPSSAEFKARYGEIARKAPVAKAEDGTADWWRKANTYTQFSYYKRLKSFIDDRVRSVGGLPLSSPRMAGPARASAYRKAMESLGSDITRTLETLGTPLHIGTDVDLVHLTFPEVYAGVGRAMDELVGDAEITNLALYNYGTAVSFTRLMNVVHEAITNPAATVEDLAQFIRKTTKDSKGPNAGSELANNIISPTGKGYHYLGTNNARAAATAKATGGKLTKTAKGMQLSYSKGGTLPELLAEAILRSRDDLALQAEKNAAEWAARGISEAKELAGQEINRLTRLTASQSKMAQRQMALEIARRRTAIGEDAAAIAATPEGTQGAVVAVDAAIGEPAIKDAETVVRQERRLQEGATLEDAGDQAMSEKYATAKANPEPDELARAMRQEALEEPPIPAVKKSKTPIYDLGIEADEAIQGAVKGTLGQRMGKMFNRNYGLEENKDLLLRTGNEAARFVANAVLRPMKELMRTFSRDELAQGLRAVQQGTLVDGSTRLGQAAQGIEEIVGKLFTMDGSSQSAMGNVFLETGARLDHINQVLRWAFRGDTALQFDRVVAQADAKAILGSKATKAQIKAETDRQLRDQWRNWNFGDDAADAIVRLGQAAGRVAEHQATVASFVFEGKKAGWAIQVPKGEKVPAGFVKIGDSTGSSSFAALIPKGVYISKEIAPELARLDYLTTVSRQLQGEIGEWVRGTLLPLTNTWKQGMTIYRAGHHIRNTIGNLSVQYVSRGTRNMNESAKVALKLMGQRNDFKGMDALAALKSMGDDAIPRSGEVLFTTNRYGDITGDELWHILNKEGLLPTYAASEGLLSGEVKNDALISRILRPLDADNNPLGRLGAATSQNLDHSQRIHHFVQALMQEGSKRGGKWKGLPKEKVYRKIAEEVLSLHPDASMLTATENKYAKLAIPFYSWLRGVLPGVIESSLAHPGRVMMFPKASYNIAVAAGINPDTISDPFPEDQLFPSFIRESVFGPQLKVGDSYLRVNPGIAQADIAQTFVDPVRGILGMTNPFFRVPAELASGGSWSTGGRINDASDYIDQSIPFINYLANITGISPAGSIGSVLSGQGLDQQAAVEAGNKTDFDKALSVANWLSGVGIQNLSRPNYINLAEIEKRNEGKQ